MEFPVGSLARWVALNGHLYAGQTVILEGTEAGDVRVVDAREDERVARTSLREGRVVVKFPRDCQPGGEAAILEFPEVAKALEAAAKKAKTEGYDQGYEDAQEQLAQDGDDDTDPGKEKPPAKPKAKGKSS